MLYKPNKYGIRRLNRDLGEWALLGKDEGAKAERVSMSLRWTERLLIDQCR